MAVTDLRHNVGMITSPRIGFIYRPYLKPTPPSRLVVLWADMHNSQCSFSYVRGQNEESCCQRGQLRHLCNLYLLTLFHDT